MAFETSMFQKNRNMLEPMYKRLIVILFLITAGAAWFYFRPASRSPLKAGDKIDSLNGVYIYYNGNVGNVDGRRIAAYGYNLGLKYQCVEFVKRYYYEHLHHKMPDSYGHAKDFFDARVKDGMLNNARALTQYTNPSAVQPQVNDLIIFGPTVFNPYGHVAIVSGVAKEKIEITQQNPGPSAPSRIDLPLIKTGNRWKIDNERILGWLRKE